MLPFPAKKFYELLPAGVPFVEPGTPRFQSLSQYSLIVYTGSEVCSNGARAQERERLVAIENRLCAAPQTSLAVTDMDEDEAAILVDAFEGSTWWTDFLDRV